MCEETTPKQKYNTLAEMEADQEKIAIQFALDLKRLKDAGVPLRKIGEMKNMNHERVRQFLKKIESH